MASQKQTKRNELLSGAYFRHSRLLVNGDVIMWGLKLKRTFFLIVGHFSELCDLYDIHNIKFSR